MYVGSFAILGGSNVTKFSEGVYEFCFNYEFMHLHASSIVGTPYIPTRRRESEVGYDVKFERIRGNELFSTFFQYKVSNYVSKKTKANQDIYNNIGGPYYYYYLKRLNKSQQHNLLCDLRQREEDVYYSAPRFCEKKDLDENFKNRTIINNSQLTDPAKVGPIGDLDLHRIAYNEDGTQEFFCSEVKKIEGPYDFEALKKKFKTKKIDEKYFSELLSKLEEGISEVFHVKFKIPDKYSELPDISKCVYLLQEYHKLHWIIF